MKPERLQAGVYYYISLLKPFVLHHETEEGDASAARPYYAWDGRDEQKVSVRRAPTPPGRSCAGKIKRTRPVSVSGDFLCRNDSLKESSIGQVACRRHPRVLSGRVRGFQPHITRAGVSYAIFISSSLREGKKPTTRRTATTRRLHGEEQSPLILQLLPSYMPNTTHYKISSRKTAELNFATRPHTTVAGHEIRVVARALAASGTTNAPAISADRVDHSQSFKHRDGRRRPVTICRGRPMTTLYSRRATTAGFGRGSSGGRRRGNARTYKNIP
ncbi:hypothetical protein EVAR_48176_1 [Eumeta japonica]|uniref:Uncharacterized protein n=1 Tax=Eumeta variegata TaxID=151549 RepID=A0A4C1XUH7_EUMVA|nr:hypothetical protein EVAR_48176_1 [Eumeta japonica]